MEVEENVRARHLCVVLVSEIAVNAALAMIESEQPRGEPKCALVVQMACIHSATMTILGRLAAFMATAAS